MLRCRTPLVFFLRMFPPPPSLNPNLNSSISLLQLNPISVPRSNSPRRRHPTTSFSCNHAMTISSCSPAPILAAPHSPLSVVSFYRFADFPNHANLRKSLKDLCEELWVSGGIILAPEGINGSICGTRDSVQRVLAFIERDSRLNEVKLKKEIVTLGMPTVSPNEGVGKYVKPREWNSLISDPDTVVIDVRNNYDIRIGKFKGAVDPCTSAFCDFPSSVDDNFELTEADNGNQLSDHELDTGSSNGGKKPPRVAMYCTGGIRCEKASSFLLRKGFQEALAAEVTSTFGRRLAPLNMIVRELTGDMQLSKNELEETQLLIIDEVHLLNDDRGPVIEALVARTLRQVELAVKYEDMELFCNDNHPQFGLVKGRLGYATDVSNRSDADTEAPEWEYRASCPYCYSSKSEEKDRARQRQFEAWGVIGGPDKCLTTHFLGRCRSEE
ncbi:Rhodanese-like domain-containing protein 7 [Linum grandiflorum]